MWSELEHLYCEKELKKLSLSSWEKGRSWGSMQQHGTVPRKTESGSSPQYNTQVQEAKG